MKVRKISLTMQILMINAAILLVTTAVLGIVTTIMSEGTMVTLVKQRMIDIANAAAANVDGDVLETLSDGDQETEEFAECLDAIDLFRENTDLEYIYNGTDRSRQLHFYR